MVWYQGEIESTFQPFDFSGMLSIPRTDPTAIQILQDMGAAQSLFRPDVLPLSEGNFCNPYAMARGIEMGVVSSTVILGASKWYG